MSREIEMQGDSVIQELLRKSIAKCKIGDIEISQLISTCWYTQKNLVNSKNQLIETEKELIIEVVVC